jgi:hypothetical protein
VNTQSRERGGIKRMNLPVACSLSGAELQARRSAVLEKFRGAVVEVKETPEGYAFSLPSDGGWLLEVANLVDVERQCCPFLRFRITVEAGGPVWLELSGPEGAKEFLRAMLDEGPAEAGGRA